MARIVTPEFLDELPADHPDAIRSRRDLRRVNAVMGNYRWIARKMADHDVEIDQWLELGAGDGELANHIEFRKPVTGLDFAPRPAGWPEAWDWKSGDLFSTLPDIARQSGAIGIVANLFLHHFSDEQLGAIGELFGRKVKVLIFSEPARNWIHRAQGYLAHPFINHVTKHDMHVSIEAGFRKSELIDLLRLNDRFQVVESSHSLFGSYRVVARMNDWPEPDGLL